jgi:glutathione S-transferase
MTIDFYYVPASAPCRTFLLAPKYMGFYLNQKLKNLLGGENIKPEFIKVTPPPPPPNVLSLMWDV